MDYLKQVLIKKLEEGYLYGWILDKMPQKEIVELELFNAIRRNQDKHLDNTNKFLTELLMSLSEEQFFINSNYQNKRQENTDTSYQSILFNIRNQDSISIKEQTAVLHLSSLFHLKEYKRTSFYADKYLNEINNFSQDIVYFYSYAEYMYNCIQIKDLQQSKNIQKKQIIEKHYQSIKQAINWLENSGIQLNEFNLYILSLMYKQLNQTEQQQAALISCLNQNPFMWCAWQELSKILLTDENIDHLSIFAQIKPHWMRNFFISNLFSELIRQHQKYDQYSLGITYVLWIFFNKSIYLENQIALIFHNITSYEQSIEFFMDIWNKDPFWYESMDVLSNMLYVQDKQNELGKLALCCFEIDKNIPETCCVLGNYYSIIGDHSKAVKQFQRSILLDSNYLSSYTLLGHEYLEMKNIPMSIEAYNNALKVYKKDYRAWYGLGQVYELQNHIEFSLYYFYKAIQCNPRDQRMWAAFGNSYKKIDKLKEAQKCFEKAEALKNFEGINVFQLGQLYFMQEVWEKAYQCFEVVINKKESFNDLDKEYIEALHFQVQILQQKGNYNEAIYCAEKFLNLSQNERQIGMQLIQDLKQMENKS